MEKKTVLLGVNIDHVATVRQARLTSYPDPVIAAIDAEDGGADSITLHLREDRRHIQENDVIRLKEVLRKPMNLEMAMTDEMISFAEKIKPEFCCIVPEKREELTTEGGLDVLSQPDKTEETCRRLQKAGIRVSLFIDADPAQINAAAKAGAKVIEIHTGHYADARNPDIEQAELQKIIQGIHVAKSANLQINAGHGLNYDNVQQIAALDDIYELNIGHAIIARALYTGIKNAVNEMKKLIMAAQK